jgi:hypothetical protein
MLLSSAHTLIQLLVTLFFVIFEAFNLWGISSLTSNTTRLSRILIRLMTKPWMRQSAFGQFWFDHIIPRIRQNNPFPLATAKILRLLPVTAVTGQGNPSRVKRRGRSST